LRKLSLFCSPVSPSLQKETKFHCCLVGTKLIVVLFWQALVKVIPRTLELDPNVCEQKGACSFLDLFM
jgi:hypothetical protein